MEKGFLYGEIRMEKGLLYRVCINCWSVYGCYAADKKNTCFNCETTCILRKREMPSDAVEKLSNLGIDVSGGICDDCFAIWQSHKNQKKNNKQKIAQCVWQKSLLVSKKPALKSI